MTEKLKQTIKEEVEKLPKEMQDAINVSSWEQKSEEIGKKYLLSEEEINDFQVETLLVLVGIEDGNYYAQNIENNVGTSKDEAEKIAEEAFQNIFLPIKNTLSEHIKKSGKSKNANWKQRLDFILSGGDYSAFIEPNSPLEEYPLGGGGNLLSPSPLHNFNYGEGKARGEENSSTPAQGRATPQEGNKTEQTVLPVFSIKKEL